MYGGTRENHYAQRKPLIDTSLETNVCNDPIQQYNHVIRCYNTDENQVGGINLEEMKASVIYSSFWRFFSNPCFLVIFLILIVAPGIGIFFYFWLLAAIIIYFSRLSVFYKNAKRVGNPFQNMVFSPELCKAANVNNKFYEIKVQGKGLQIFIN